MQLYSAACPCATTISTSESGKARATTLALTPLTAFSEAQGQSESAWPMQGKATLKALSIALPGSASDQHRERDPASAPVWTYVRTLQKVSMISAAPGFGPAFIRELERRFATTRNALEDKHQAIQ